MSHFFALQSPSQHVLNLRNSALIQGKTWAFSLRSPISHAFVLQPATNTAENYEPSPLRTWLIPAEVRVRIFDADVRLLAIENENRVGPAIQIESRGWSIAGGQNRLYVVND